MTSIAARRHWTALRGLLEAARTLVLGIALTLAIAVPGRAAPPPTPGLLQRVAFGSCADQAKPQPVWDAVLAAKPDVFVLAGDNIYGDTENMAVLQRKYEQLDQVPGFRRLRRVCPVYGTWDDHDFGRNDAGADYPKRVESQRLFVDFMGDPPQSERRRRPGVYEARVIGPVGRRVQLVLLDTRYFRSPLQKAPLGQRAAGPYTGVADTNTTLLGPAQWTWLETQLRVPAELRLIVSSIQVVAEDHGWEKWMNFPHERQRLLQLIRTTAASGVVFLSGDRHLAELSMMDGGVGYPLYDLTSSGLNKAAPAWRKLEANRHRVATMAFGDNFGLIEIDWSGREPVVSLQIRDVEGRTVMQQRLGLSVLRPGTIAPPAPAQP